MIQLSNYPFRIYKMESCEYPKFIPLDAVVKHYLRWDCEIQTNVALNVHYKCLQGEGEIEFVNGNKYKGSINRGMLDGVGTFQWANGVTYEGQFIQNAITGKGVFRWPDGSFYDGEVIRGFREGRGKFYSKAENYSYNGTWKRGLKCGIGKIRYKDQSIYEGQFENDYREGHGKIVYPSKNEYEGEWKADRKEGKGVMNWYNLNEKYDGSWKNNLPDGYGEYYWYENKVEFKIIKNVYKGWWRQGKREGYGAFFYSNGCRYEGLFVNNAKEGIGIFIDEFGFAKAQMYKNDRVVSLLGRNLQRLEQIQNKKNPEPERAEIKLPKIGGKKPPGKNSIEQSAPLKQKQVSFNYSNQPVRNEYEKYIDFEHNEINGNFYNFLLRLNSRLRTIYKGICSSNPETKDFYTGMTMQNYWKALREAKLLNSKISLVKIDREFNKGSRSQFELTLASKLILDNLQQKTVDLKQTSYEQVLWKSYICKLQNQSLSVEHLNSIPEWSTLRQRELKQIHCPGKIVLFRHFVCLIVKTAALFVEEKEETLKSKIEEIVATLENSYDSNLKNQKILDSMTLNSANKSICVPEWSKQFHEKLIISLMPANCGFSRGIDVSLPVRTLYSLMEICGIFKDNNDKISCLERVERYLNIRVSLLKKEWKPHFGEFEKVITQSPYFNYVMNYEMNRKQINEFLFTNINRKATASNQQQFRDKYLSMMNCLISTSELMKANQPKKLGCKMRAMLSEKDGMKERMIRQAEELKSRLAEEKRKRQEQQKQGEERLRMSKEDHDVEDLPDQSLYSDEYIVE